MSQRNLAKSPYSRDTKSAAIQLFCSLQSFRFNFPSLLSEKVDDKSIKILSKSNKKNEKHKKHSEDFEYQPTIIGDRLKVLEERLMSRLDI